MENQPSVSENYAFIREGAIYGEGHHVDVTVMGFFDRETHAFISSNGIMHYQISLRQLAELKPEFASKPHYLDHLSEDGIRAVFDLAEFSSKLGFMNSSRELTEKLNGVKRLANSR